ncbi:MAG: Bcr/CflA family drug resistance efflux transporter [Micrococcales bacterium]|nr:MAG: Bcr/CflA family drug resistance efflux transporter [Micrococcales bacterium]
MIAGLLGFFAASIGCALSTNLTMLLIFRALQGMLVGAATIVGRVVIRDMHAGAQAQRLMSRVMTIFAIAPVVAPIIGGWLLLIGDWPVIFLFVAGYAAVLALVVWRVLPETLPAAGRQPMHVGALLAGLWVVAKDLAFERLAFAAAATFAGYFIYVVGAPIVIVELLGLGEQDYWKLMAPMVMGMAGGAAIAGRLAYRLSAEELVDRAMIGAIGAGALNLLIAVVWPGPPQAFIGPAMLGVAVGVAFPILQLRLLDLFPDRRGAAGSMGTFASLMFNAALASVIVPLVSASLATVALTGLVLVIIGAGLWRWHRIDDAEGQNSRVAMTE